MIVASDKLAVLANISVPPPFGVLPACAPCPDCVYHVAWGNQQRLATACTAGVVFGVMLSAVVYKYVKPWNPMVRLRKISGFAFLEAVPEHESV